jgi:RNA recognition motif-containing protein
MEIFAGSLPFKLEEDDIRQLFEKYGEVASVKLITDKYSGRKKGFGFVDMPNEEEANKAIAELNGYEVEGRAIVVNKSEGKKDRGEGGGGGFRGGNRGGGGGGYNKGGGGGGYNRGGGGGGYRKDY